MAPKPASPIPFEDTKHFYLWEGGRSKLTAVKNGLLDTCGQKPLSPKELGALLRIPEVISEGPFLVSLARIIVASFSMPVSLSQRHAVWFNRALKAQY